MSVYKPMKLFPCFKEYLWGGKRLRQEFGKKLAPQVTAESWELSCHPDGISRIDGGIFSGMTIEQLGQCDRAGFWGTGCLEGEFPILVKLIDAARDLSIQVHPSDESALPELGERGKAEMWYIVDSMPQAFLYLGFSRKIGREEFLSRARDGSICDVLNKVPVAPGDVFYILPGTVHAIGKGIVVAEIQQNSNTTFRVYDYQRIGTDGLPRPLHLDRAAQAASLEPTLPEECKANSLVLLPSFTISEMFSCQYFRAYRIDVRETARLRCDGKSFQHLLCVEGEGAIFHDGTGYNIGRGESYFLPAMLGEYEISGNCRLLMSRV